MNASVHANVSGRNGNGNVDTNAIANEICVSRENVSADKAERLVAACVARF